MDKIADSKNVPNLLRYAGTWALVVMLALAASMLRDVREGLTSLQRETTARAAADDVRNATNEKDKAEINRRLAILEQKNLYKQY